MRHSAARRTVLAAPSILALAAALTACHPKLSEHESQAAPVAAAILEAAADLCDDYAFKVQTDWQATVGPQTDREFSRRFGKELAAREGQKIGAQVAFLLQEADARVRLLEQLKHPGAELARDAYLTSRNFCATVAYPDVWSPLHLKGQIEERRATRNSAIRRLELGGRTLSKAGKEELNVIRRQLPRSRPAAEASPARRSVAEPPRRDPDPNYERKKALLSLQSLTFRTQGKEMRIEGRVVNMGNMPLPGTRVKIQLEDFQKVVRTLRIPLDSKRLIPQESANFTWFAPLDSNLQYCRVVSFEIGEDDNTVSFSGPAPARVYVQSSR